MLDQGYAGAEAGEHLGDLAPDGPAADDGRGGRQLGGRVHVLTRPEGHRADAGDARLPEPGAGRDDERAPADAALGRGQAARAPHPARPTTPRRPRPPALCRCPGSRPPPADARLASVQEAEALDPALTPERAQPLALHAV